MPDSEGKLTEADIRQVQDWMRRQGTGAHFCPICSSGQWTIGQHLVKPTVASGLMWDAVSYPNVMLISPCGYTRFMNAVFIGLVPGNKA